MENSQKKSKHKIILATILLLILGITGFILYQKNQPQDVKVKFGWMTDVHLGDNNHAEKIATLGKDAILRTMPKIVDHGAEFTVVTGDMIDNFHKNHDEVINFHKQVKNLFDQFPLKTYYVIGNHDVETTTKQEVVDIYNLPAKNYTFQEKGMTFVVLDQQFNPDGSSYNSGNHHIAGAILTDQLEWVEQEIKKAPNAVVVLTHQPIFSVEDEETTGGQIYTHNGQLLQEILEKNSKKVKAVLSGHRQPSQEEMIREFGGIKHLILPSAIFKDTRLSYGIIEIDTEENKVNFKYFMDANQEKASQAVERLSEECRGKDEKEDYQKITNLAEENPEKFQKIQELFYNNKDNFRESEILTEEEKSDLRDFEDYDCYKQYLEARKEFSGY
jgi:predicted MPP superfamily phosphohydrolase